MQAAKDPLAGKGPRVTTAISLPGRTLVHLPGGRGVGISRRILDDSERDRLRHLLEALPGGGGWIARTAAVGATPEELEADRAYLVDLAGRVSRKAEDAGAPTVLIGAMPAAARARTRTSPRVWLTWASIGRASW